MQPRPNARHDSDTWTAGNRQQEIHRMAIQARRSGPSMGISCDGSINAKNKNPERSVSHHYYCVFSTPRSLREHGSQYYWEVYDTSAPVSTLFGHFANGLQRCGGDHHVSGRLKSRAKHA